MGFGAAVLSLGAASVFSMFALAARNESSKLVAHAAESQLVLEEVESALLVGSTALDAYLASGEPRHRKLYLRASIKLEPALARLERLAATDPQEKAECDRLLPRLEVFRAESAKVLALADAGDMSAARRLREHGDGARAAKQAKESVDELETHEEREVALRQAAWTREIRASNAVFAVAMSVLFVLIALAARVVRDEIRLRERKEDERARALEVQRRFMAVVSHDLRNPLTGVLASGWALARANLPADAAVLVRRIISSGRRMERLIRDLLDWSRVHAGAPVPLTVCDADVYDVCRRISEELSERQNGRIRLERDGDTHALFDPDRMEQVVANLVGNALKYSPAEATVRVRAVGLDAEVRLEVLDEGPGIPPETRKTLFEPFHRGSGDAKDGSSLGLGLFIVRTLTEAQGGRIEVHSEAGQGTAFVVRVPRATPRASAAPSPTH
jgi:signal transduction histidine kinase